MEGFKLVAAILPTGSTCKVLDAAREAWAEGGTILLARGTGVHEARRFFGLSVSSERELLLIWWNGKGAGGVGRRGGRREARRARAGYNFRAVGGRGEGHSASGT